MKNHESFLLNFGGTFDDSLCPYNQYFYSVIKYAVDSSQSLFVCNKLVFGQTRFAAAADPIEHISEEKFLLQIFAKMETL